MQISPQDELFAFTLLSRVCDLLSTWLVTPKLKLEANPIVRRFRWPFGFLTLAFVAYWQPEIAVMIATSSFLVAASNSTRIAASRLLGEDKLYEMALTQAGMGRFWPGLLWRLASLPCYLALAGLIFFLCPSPQEWGNYIGIGIVIYVFVYALHGSIAYKRLRKIAHAQGGAPK
jgi:hypothetical protein